MAKYAFYKRKEQRRTNYGRNYNFLETLRRACKLKCTIIFYLIYLEKLAKELELSRVPKPKRKIEIIHSNYNKGEHKHCLIHLMATSATTIN